MYKNYEYNIIIIQFSQLLWVNYMNFLSPLRSMQGDITINIHLDHLFVILTSIFMWSLSSS